MLLAAHSMGAWVAMETVKSLRSVDRLVDRIGEVELRGTVDVLGGTMLFPSIVNIAKSKNGRVVTVCGKFLFPWVVGGGFFDADSSW